MIRRRVVVHGTVQGVYYRDECRTEARRLGCGGWVRNRPDLAVEAVIEGPHEAVHALVAWCHQGPPTATVSTVEVTEEQPEGLSEFDVVW